MFGFSSRFNSAEVSLAVDVGKKGWVAVGLRVGLGVRVGSEVSVGGRGVGVLVAGGVTCNKSLSPG